MKHNSLKSWSGVIEPLQKRAQVAALCYRETTSGREVLLITSRDTGRWIVPKGWPIEGLDGPGSALQEAWEEAGVRKAEITSKPVGYFDYDKGLRDGETTPVEATVYLTLVTELANDYPEVDERTREWMSPLKAADLVDEPELKEIIRGL